MSKSSVKFCATARFSLPKAAWLLTRNSANRNRLEIGRISGHYAVEGFVRQSSKLIHDRDPVFTKRFNALLRSAGIKPIRLPHRSPNLNAYAERFVKSIRSECLDKMIFFGEDHLRHTIGQYLVLIIGKETIRVWVIR